MKRLNNIMFTEGAIDEDSIFYYESLRNASMAFKKLPNGNYKVLKIRFSAPIDQELCKWEVLGLINSHILDLED